MRTTILTMLLIQLSLFSFSQYCTSNGNTSFQTSTTRVVFNTIDNSTGKPSAYSDYTSISTTVDVGSAYNLTTQVNTDGNYTIHTIVWIDWNQNDSFTDSGEQYDLGTAINTGNGATNNSPLSITVPLTAVSGSTRMRVSSKYNADATSCETGFDGEVEDYTINVVSSGSVTFYNVAADNGYTYFDNARSSATPRFTISSSGTFDAMNFEINTADDFTGTSYTQTITGLSGATGTHYDLLCDNLSPTLPTTNGAVYYVRARASSDGGGTWGSWSTETWSFTHDVANYGWFQTAQKQFEEGNLTGSFIYNTTNGTTADYLYMNRGSFDVRAATDDGVKECGSWYPSANYMTIGYQNSNCTGEIYNGTRFPSTPIPNGSNVLTATYYLDDNDGCPSYDATTVSVYVYGYDIDNAPTLSSSLDSYTSTTNTVNWDMSFTYSDDGIHTLSGVDGIVEEIISRPGWNENNALSLLVNGRAGEVDAGCVSQADNGVTTAPRLDGTFTNFPNYWLSPAIEFASLACSPNYEQLVWDADQTYGTVLVQLYYDNGGTPTIIPDGALTGNSSGFAISPVDISGLNTTTYGKLYIRAILRYTSVNTNQTPKLNSWGIVADPVASVDLGTNQTICPAASITINATGCGAYEWSTGETTASITVSPASTTTYSVTATVGDGDTDIDDIVITVATPVSVTPASATICSGETVSLTASGSTAYTWSASPADASLTGQEHNVTINVSPTANTTYTATDDVCLTDDDATITINPDNTISLTSAANTDNQTVCINNAIIDITYSTTGATGASFSGLPAGVSGSWASNVVTISGTPTASNTFNYTVTLTGGCGTITANGTITVDPENTVSLTSAVGTDNQTICINTALTNITYSTSGATGATITGLPVGVTGSWASNVVTISGTPTVGGTFNYTVALTGGCGTVSTTGIITVNPENTITLTSAPSTESQTLCVNNAIVDITYSTANATGASFTGLPTGVTGSWSSNVVTISGTPTASGTFNYTVTLTGGCGTVTANGTITVNPENTISLTSAPTTDNQSVCINIAIVDITYSTANATGATFTGLPTGVSGSWASNVVTISGTPTASGIFNYTIDLTGGCGTVSATGTITVNPKPVIDSILVTDVTVCSSPYDGIIAVYPTGNQYSFDGGAFTATNHVDTLSVGSHTITLQDVNGCTVDSTVTVNSNTGISIDSIVAGTIMCYGGTTNITVYDVDAVQYSIDNGSSYQANSNFTNVIAGTYTVMIKDISGCQAADNITVSEPDSISINLSSTDVSCANAGTATVVATGGTGSLSYLWSNSDTLATINNLTAGTYTVIVTDANSCTQDSSVQVNIGNLIGVATSTVQNIGCFGDSTGSIVVGLTLGNAPYTYNWNPTNSDTSTISGLPIGSYAVTIIDAFGCTADTSITITQPNKLELTASVNNINCYGDNNGKILLNISEGTSPYSIDWGNGTVNNIDSLTNLQADTFNIVVTDNNSCTADTVIIISEPNEITLNATVTNIKCYGENNGAISLTVNNAINPYSVLWSNSETTDSIGNLSDSTYSVIITDNNNCTVYDTLHVTQPDNITLNESVTNVSCYGYNDGSVSLQVTGATSPYQFNWSNSANTESINNLIIGQYFVEVIDSNNCNYKDTFIVTQPEVLSFNTNINYDNNLGNITIETTGGTPEYIYNWSNSANGNTNINLEGGNYIVTITDANSCADTLYFSIDEVDPIIVPTVITPNSDGINDTWNIKNIENIDDVEIHIFNRWGDLVFSIKTTGTNYANMSEQWDGKFNGKDLPLGTYVYILIADEEEYNGTVTIVR